MGYMAERRGAYRRGGRTMRGVQTLAFGDCLMVVRAGETGESGAYSLRLMALWRDEGARLRMVGRPSETIAMMAQYMEEKYGHAFYAGSLLAGYYSFLVEA